ncbi:MAG: AAA family ATPase [Candidatus Competibacter sp.]|nr:AAA family ATPase [Candidatus Competibacter sp.]MDG4606594.1 AAA family ATPase [Candidatus Contendobacter sp.]HRD48610.1 AAA family ATPase [Candidatus Contendobacter sp.]
MLDSLFVRNFRLFKKLEIERLSRVNLIVGKNNSGKSCFLEAVRIYMSNASPNVLFELISQRNELWELDIQDEEQNIHDYENPLRYLFYGYHLPRAGDEGIQIGLLQDIQSNLCVRTQLYQIISSEDGRRIHIIPQQEIPNIDANLVGGVALEIEKGELKRLLPLDELIRPSRIGVSRNRFLSYSLEIKENIQIVPAGGMSESRISLLWDNINLTDLEDEVINCLKLINGYVKGVALVGSEQARTKYRIPIIRLEQSSERLPLKSMGDGMTRLFHLILALANAKDGTLLVDEFENGLHWSVLPKVWDTVFKLSERLNVQVFATTHSRDCIQGFKRAWEQNQSLGSFHRLDPDPENGAKSISYSLETLSDALDMDVEVR